MLLSDVSRGWYVTNKGIPFWVLLLRFLSILENLTLSIWAEINFPGYFIFKNHDSILALFFIKFSSYEHNLRRVWLRWFGVVWMSRQVMEILIAISRFYIQICNNFTIFNTNFRVKKCNASFAWLICKFDISMAIIKTTQKNLNFLPNMCPDKKYRQYI